MLTTPKLRADRFVSRFPIFYGWVVLSAATLGLILPFFGHNTTIGLFMDHFIADFGLDRTAVSGLFGLGGFLAALTLPYVGKLIDRYGGRGVGLVTGGFLAVSLVALATAASPLVLFILFVAMRGLGVGPLQITHSTVIAQWFRSQRGRVMGITVIVMWLFQSVYVPLLQDLLATYTWRQIWLALGVVVGLLVVPLVWLLTRDRPENFGLLPDGESQTAQSGMAAEDNWTLSEARRTPTFWIFAMGRILMPAIGSSLILHQISIFETLGYEPVVAAQTFSMASIVAAVSSIFAGVMVDRLRPGLVMVCQLATSLFMLVLAMTMSTPWLLVPYALSFGMNIGLGGVFDNAVWANLFGREHLGEIRGFITTMMSVGIAVGPVLFGWSFDTFASYHPVLLAFVILVVIQMVLAYIAPAPQRRNPSGTAAMVGAGD